MLRSGLVSISFRKLTPAEIVSLTVRAGLAGIEWGGDVHVPHGDLVQARRVRQMTLDAGLQVAAYGSYHRIWPQEPCPFEMVVETALALGAPVIRVWAGKLPSHAADAAHRAAIVAESQRIADLAAQAKIAVAYEYHGNTLTDTDASAQALLRAVAHPNLYTYWQPPQGSRLADNLIGLAAVLPRLYHVHVFHWLRAPGAPPTVVRRPLAEGQADWIRYLDRVASTGRDHFALLEFVSQDAPEQLLHDAATLNTILHKGIA